VAREAEIVGLERAVELFERRGVPLSLRELDRGAPFAWRTTALALGPLLLAVNQYGGAYECEARAPNQQYSLALSRSDVGAAARDAREEIALACGRTAWLASPGSTGSIRCGTGHRSIHLMLPTHAVTAAIAAMTGLSVREPPRFPAAQALDRGPGATLARLLELAEHEITCGNGALAWPLVAARFADAVVFALVTCVTRDRAQASAEPDVVRAAADYLATHAAEPIRMTELAAATGLGLRAIQQGFKKHRGQSLQAFLRERRLMLARAQLLAGSTASVTEVALGCGFAHVGRFSGQYRARFGEPPSTTARRNAAT
jgi:AraC-like DNA-binding protein